MAALIPQTQELDSLIRNGMQSIDMLGSDEYIVLVGCTGSGKSTFLKFLLKDPTLQIALNRQEDCIFIDGETTIGSENCLTSKTLVPNLKKDEETGLVVLDCAGFEDTRSAKDDLIASFLNKTVLDKAKKIKLVIVESYDKLRLNLDRNAFRNVLSHVAGLLKYNHTSFSKQSICFVATKIESQKSDEALIRSVKTFFEDSIKYLEEKFSAEPSSDDNLREIEILRFLIANSQIGLFRRPTEVADDPWGLPALQENFKSLRKLIFQDMEHTPDDCGKFNIVVSHKTQIWICGPLIENTIEDLKKLLASIANTIEKSIFVKLDDNDGEVEEKLIRNAELGEQIAKQLSSIQSPEDLENFAEKEGVEEETIEELQYQTTKTIFLFGVVERDGSEIKDLIVGLNGGVDAITLKVKASVGRNRFILNLAKEAESYEVRLVNEECMELFDELNASNFRIKMTNLRRLGFNELISTQALDLKHLSDNQINDLKALYREKNENFFNARWEGDRLLVLGRYAFLSQVLREINATNRSQVEQVVLATTQNLYIDRDMTLKHTHLSLIAPIIEIIKEKRVITLEGEDGVPHLKKQAQKSKGDHPGRDGLNGNPGSSSGSFTLIALDVLNSSLLEVRSRGGSGSDGQHGGDGWSGSPCQYPVLDELGGPVRESLNFTQYFIDHCKAKGYEVDIDKQEWMLLSFLLLISMAHKQFTLTVKKNPDDKATNGGRGGNGGSRAVAGEVNLKVRNSVAVKRASIILNKGENGKPGKGGMAGSNAKVKFRKYQCMYRSILGGLWRVTVDKLLNQGECDYKGHVASDGKDGSVNEGGINLRYKYSDESLLPIEEIAESLDKYAADHDFDEDPSFKDFKNFVHQNFL